MNPELDQDDINIEEFLYPCLNDKNGNLKVNLNATIIFNKTLVNIFEYYWFFEKAEVSGKFSDLPDNNPNNNTAFGAMDSLYEFIPIFSDAQSCDELEYIINQNLGQITTYLNSVENATNTGVLEAKPFILKLQASFNELLIVLNTVCNIYGLA
jgi:hypothetical protein